MGNTQSLSNIFTSNKLAQSLPIDTAFQFPAPIPSWPSANELEGGFGSGYIDLGGLLVHKISTFNKIWSTQKGGPGNLGATFFEPSKIPDGFFMLGSYAQPNNRKLFGWTLVGKDTESSTEILKKPTDYTLVWSSKSTKSISTQDGYIWAPSAPEGYKPVGHVVTTTPEKPSVDKIRCVLAEFTDELEHEPETWIWGTDKTSTASKFNLFGSRPRVRGIQAPGVSINSFTPENGSLACLKNKNFSTYSFMPNLTQIQALFQAYSPLIHFHPEEKYHPSSINWYFSQGTLLYTKGDESNPVSIKTNGENLPQDGSNDGAFWIDLPADEKSRETVKKGDLQSAESYLHIKPMFGGIFTDIVVWIFYPFNGPGTAKLGLIDIPLGRIGEHIADWEHVTLRISNFDGILQRVYFSQHSKGAWVEPPLLELHNGNTNKPVGYAALNGHPNYPEPGLVLQGSGSVGIRNDTAKSDKFLDTGARFSVVSGEYLGSDVVEPPWVRYLRHWGPTIAYDSDAEAKRVEALLKSANLKSSFQKLVNVLPKEFYGEEGPTGPRVKSTWNEDERAFV